MIEEEKHMKKMIMTIVLLVCSNTLLFSAHSNSMSLQDLNLYLSASGLPQEFLSDPSLLLREFGLENGDSAVFVDSLMSALLEGASQENRGNVEECIVGQMVLLSKAAGVRVEYCKDHKRVAFRIFNGHEVIDKASFDIKHTSDDRMALLCSLFNSYHVNPRAAERLKAELRVVDFTIEALVTKFNGLILGQN